MKTTEIKKNFRRIISQISPHKINFFLKSLLVFLFIISLVLNIYQFDIFRAQKNKDTKFEEKLLKTEKVTSNDLTALKNQDQYKINQSLESTINQIQDTYSKTTDAYEKLLDLQSKTKDTGNLENLFADTLHLLSLKNYSSASADLQLLSLGIQQKQDALVSGFTIPQNVTASNSLPGPGFSQQTVNTDVGTFLADIVSADLNSTRVIVDTASSTDCGNNCPVMSLGDYVGRNGAFAGINGTFFCPSEYPSCAGKTNSFDTLLMSKNKYYFNSGNNVYSTVPLVYFSGNTMGVRTQSENWGRDTGVDSVIAMQPLLVYNSQIAFGGSSDGKFTNKGTRDFIASNGSMVYIGVIFNADMNDAAHVLKTLGVQNALNLDEGGSTALWYGGGYKAGPGRNIPNAVLFVRK